MNLFDRLMMLPDFEKFVRMNKDKSTEEIIVDYKIMNEFIARRNSQKFTNDEISA